MDPTENVSSLELGRHLTQVRERAGIKQAELARRVTWSPAVLSRIESGERALARLENHRDVLDEQVIVDEALFQHEVSVVQT